MILIKRLEAWTFRYISKYWKIYLYSMEEKTKENSIHKLKTRTLMLSSILNKEKRTGHGFYVIHRLDYSTSGVLLVGLNKKAASEAAKLFEKRETQKFYIALVRGHIQDPGLDINIPIGEDGRPESANVKMCSAKHSYCVKPRPSRTRCLVLERGLHNGQPASKVLLAPLTGRRHQLRVHMYEIGNTIVGDYTYSNRRDLSPYRMFLHAIRLRVESKLETIDVNTEDPFTEQPPTNQWTSTSVLHRLPAAFDLMYSEDIDWTRISV
ncbi:RNA pseudouridylate synthase domain-containing protein 1-like isoform X2 [Eurytemora carolleeae]|uniref:RNA pseudouridylate synthase domain-containing protein 1-like isoform X2 n=1 Tax=Eurytemora carolleeae TaxID=1294199 RepID=UPI000C771B48|nr:RNA pseudouridylate synthase domain-containing protein 1-like isoform X2 [Eurytemora carolleeae]|eukprot:XP_023346502.1 RNA pseudouridylate synthase domain-containing protein 1-like isoform X2 [Eurytemora affinis]